MKKLLLLLLLPYFAIAQVSNGREFEVEAIKTTGSQTITTPVYLVTEGVDGTHGKTTATGFQNAITGTANYLTKFGSGGVVQSQIFDNGISLSIGAIDASAKFRVLNSFGSSLNAMYVEQGEYDRVGIVVKNSNASAIANIFQVENSTGVIFSTLPNGNSRIGNAADNGSRLQVNGNITANAATLSNHVVVKSQLDAVASSGTYTPTLTAVTNVSSLSLPAASSSTYTKIGNIVNVMVSVSVTPTTGNTGVNFTVSLPINRTSSANKFIGFGTCLNLGTGADVEISSNSTTLATVLFLTSASVISRIVILNFQYDITQ
jgi:hypothetical protein